MAEAHTVGGRLSGSGVVAAEAAAHCAGVRCIEFVGVTYAFEKMSLLLPLQLLLSLYALILYDTESRETD